ncbi:MAG: PDZ domain-containing protein [Proteobacteria bacterium]|nr:PDZ domain-containing protein [Pseudomonadota bacterium]
MTHPRVCFVEAYRMDGAFMSRGGRTRVDLLEDDVELDFVLDEYPTGGMGISLRALPEGMYVRGVAPDGPADRAGIVAGELIAQIDDAPLAGMSQSEMVATGTGEIGATMELVVIGETGERRVTLDREWVELWL